MSGNITSIALGQGGVQLSHALWELYCVEHGISASGSIIPDPDYCTDLEHKEVFFCESEANQFVPRAIIADLEPNVVDQIKMGAYKHLFHPENLLTANEDAANLFARGYYTMGRAMLDTTMDRIRNCAEQSDRIQGFLITSGIAGGTGSGFASALIENMSLEYGTVCKVMMNIFPSMALSSSILDPYNLAHATNSNIEHSDINLTLDNEASFTACRDCLQIRRPNFSDINRLMAQVASALTGSLRFQCQLNSDLMHLQVNLVPYPRIHFPVVSYAPITCQEFADHEKLDTRRLILDLFTQKSQLVSCNLMEGAFMACNIIFRGQITAKDINDGIMEVKSIKDVKFVDWCPTGFKFGICNRPSLIIPGTNLASTKQSAIMLSNSTSIKNVWEAFSTKFQSLFQKKAFVHWYVGEGMEESEFEESYNELVSIIEDYEDVGKASEENEENKDEEPTDAA